MSGSGIKGGGRFSGIGPGHFMLAHYRKPGAAGTSLEYKTVLLFSLFLPGCGPGSNITAHTKKLLLTYIVITTSHLIGLIYLYDIMAI